MQQEWQKTKHTPKKNKKDGNKKNQPNGVEKKVGAEDTLLDAGSGEDMKEDELETIIKGEGGKGGKEEGMEEVEDGDCDVALVVGCEWEDWNGEGKEQEGDREENEERAGMGEDTSAKKSYVPDIDYLTDLTELRRQWKSTNSQSLGELWFHLLKQVLILCNFNSIVCTYTRTCTYIKALIHLLCVQVRMCICSTVEL